MKKNRLFFKPTLIDMNLDEFGRFETWVKTFSVLDSDWVSKVLDLERANTLAYFGNMPCLTQLSSI